MTKTLTALAAAAVIGLATTAAPSTANARCVGCAVGAGIIGGIAAGAIIAGATRPAYAYPGYAPVTGYDPYYEYAAPGPVACPGGYWARRPIVDRWGNFVGYSRPRFFCP